MSDQQPIRVLYMEDDSGVARLFQKKLEQVGYSVDLASDGGQGLAMHDAGAYDVLALDQRMPVYDGLEVIRILAARGQLPPTIMVTGTGNERIAVEALKLGASDYVVKDIGGGYLELIPSVIEQALNRRRLIRERQQALEALERRNRNLALLNRAGQTLTATLNMEQIVTQLLSRAMDVAEAEIGAVWLCDEARVGCLKCQRLLYRGGDISEENCSVALGEGLVGRVAENGESVLIPDAYNYPDLLYAQVSAHVEVNSLLLVPLWAHDTLLGVLHLINKTKSMFNQDDLSLVETLAASAAIAIENARLIEMLRQHSADLETQNEDLDAFSHTVAHDLKNPVSNIIGFCRLLIENEQDFPEEEKRTFVNQIIQCGHKMNNIIDELLLLAKIRKAEVQVGPIDMAHIVGEAQRRLADMFQQHNATITTPRVWPATLGHGPWVEEVWVNYLSNAIKYGGKPPIIELGAETQPDDMVKLWVHDNGSGIPADKHAQLFTPFTRLGQIRAQGYGLGLSIVRRIVEKLNGHVEVASEIGQGTTFSFTLPSATTYRLSESQIWRDD